MKRVLILCAGAAVLAGSAFGQGAIIREGVAEVGGFVGISRAFIPSDASLQASNTTRVMGGGNVVYSLTRVFMPFAEVSYFPSVAQTVPVSGFAGAKQTISVPAVDANAGFHWRIPIPRSRVIPYFVSSLGDIYIPSGSITPYYPVPGSSNQFVAGSPVPRGSSSEFAVSGGAGLRYYTTERLGFRAEFKTYHALTGTYTNTFWRVAFGFFYQF